MTEQPKKDRDYYRALSDRELIEEVRYAIDPDWKELAFALGERLYYHNYEHAWVEE